MHLPTGITGLNEVLRGGLPRHRLYLLQGPPGSGKTTVAMQFLLEGVRRGERCLYVSLSESEEEIQGVAASHAWSLEGINIYDLSVVEHHLLDEEENSLFKPAEVELQETTQPLMAEIARLSPSRVVFDSLSELRMLAVNPLRYRRRILALKQLLAKHGCTTLLLDDGTSDPKSELQLQSLAHGVIELTQTAPVYGRERRHLRIVKMRGVSFTGGSHDIVIQKGGVVLYPRPVAGAEEGHARGPISSGLPALDDLMGGGPPGGSSTLIVGPAGSGKSLVMSLYALQAAALGQRAVIFTFEESPATFMARSRGLGLEVESEIAAGRLIIERMDPADLSPSEFAHHVRTVVEQQGATVVGIDSLNGYLNAMPEERYLSLQLHELLAYLGRHGVTTFLLMVQNGLFGANMQSPVDVSYVADNVIMLRYFEAAGKVRKMISVIKKRAGEHEPSIRELIIAKGGVSVGPPLHNFHGILTGVPTYQGPLSELAAEV